MLPLSAVGIPRLQVWEDVNIANRIYRGKSWDERICQRVESHAGRTITVWGM